MIERLRLTTIVMVKFVVLLFMVQGTMCTSKSSTLEAAPTSFPASELW